MTGNKTPVGRNLPPGTLVRLDGGERTEYGIVIHCWLDNELGVYDCYVAFFGEQLPTGKPVEKPYVLRYSTASLTVLSSADRPD